MHPTFGFLLREIPRVGGPRDRLPPMKTAPLRTLLLAVCVACQPTAEPTPQATPVASSPAPAGPPASGDAPAASDAAARSYSVDLFAKAKEFAQDRPDATDGEFYVYRSDHATVHMHLIGVGQMCPMHIHRTTHEATVIVSGQPKVVHVYGEAGSLTRVERRVPPGQLVYSRPLTGHQWTNVESTPQGNLVFAAPRFDGNLYLHTDDDRMLPGPPPTLIDPATALAETTTSELRATGLLDGQLTLALVRDPLPVHRDPTRDTILYVAHGTGELSGLPLRPGMAAVLSGGEAAELKATTEAGLAAWVFAPPRPEPG